MRYLLLFLSCCFAELLKSQPYVEGGNTRHRFAQLNLGLDVRYFPGAGTSSYTLGAHGQEKMNLGDKQELRLIIGGTHFWGHADFFIAFPVLTMGSPYFFTGAETGTKIFPWKIRSGKLSPYLGMSWLPVFYAQGEGALDIQFKFPLTAGIVYNHKNHLFELGAAYNYDYRTRYYINTTTHVPVNTHSLWLALTYKFMIETTISAEKDWLSGKTQRITDTLGKTKRLNGLTLSVGPSSAFFIKPSPHLSAEAPYAGQHRAATIFPEFGAGYYFHRPDLQFNLAYRRISSDLIAYGYSQVAKREALSLEAFKFLFDYHGFAWFTGVSVSYEKLSVRETMTNGSNGIYRYEGLKPGVTFGWDIRPNRLQMFYLRTALRYFPDLGVKMQSGKNVFFDMIEFNFIQLVLFPERI